MRIIKYPFAAVIMLMAISLSECRKNKDDPQLPPETTTGAMTFGCKVNNRVFIPRDGNGKPGLYVQYINLGNVPDGGWHLNIPAYNYKTKEGVNIETDSLVLVEGSSYALKKAIGCPSAFYISNNKITWGVDVYETLDNDSGKLFISKADKVNRILSGTFYFTGTNSENGLKVAVTEGRFDIRY